MTNNITWLKTVALAGLIAASVAVSGLAQTPGQPATDDAVIMEIDGARLTLADLERRRPDLLFAARNKFYQAERTALDQVIDEYLLEQQAKKENVTVAGLLERHVANTIAQDPSEESLRVYYEGVDTTQPFEAVRGQILEALRQRRTAKAKHAYLQTLRDQAAIVIRLGPPRAQVALTGTPVRGVADAPVVLVEYADYECPYCQQVNPTLDRLVSDYQGKLAFAYKDAPLPIHPHAEAAAEAADCAAVQGKFWEFHDLLFSSKQLEVGNLKEAARTLALDTTAFDKCLDSGEQAEHVKLQLAEFQGYGMQGTPSFLINGRMLSGVLGYEQFRAIIEEELVAAESQLRDRRK